MECSNAWRRATRAKVWMIDRMIDKSWAWNACHYLLCVYKSNIFFFLARRIESTRDNVVFSSPRHSFSGLAFDLTNRNVSLLEPDAWFGILLVSRVVSDVSKHRDRQVHLEETNWSSMISFLFSMAMLMIVYIVELLFFSIKPCRSFFRFFLSLSLLRSFFRLLAPMCFCSSNVKRKNIQEYSSIYVGHLRITCH